MNSRSDPPTPTRRKALIAGWFGSHLSVSGALKQRFRNLEAQRKKHSVLPVYLKPDVLQDAHEPRHSSAADIEEQRRFWQS